MRTFMIAKLGTLALVLCVSTEALAQGDRGRDGGIVIRGPEGSVVIIGDDDILRRLPRGRGDRGRGSDDPFFRGHGGEGIPAFCRTGEGHPVFGLQWCFDRRMRDEGIPAFCRTGEGHPEFGRRWCLERGYGLGSLRGVIFGNDTVFLDLENENDVVVIRPSIWERILGGLLGGRGRR
ncbi:MAG TPA: hypothetical protein VJP59_07590 [Gemmatimonadota bacterium]|nr:hypothetical protein [Gemmatimonadota bacterium]